MTTDTNDRSGLTDRNRVGVFVHGDPADSVAGLRNRGHLSTPKKRCWVCDEKTPRSRGVRAKGWPTLRECEHPAFDVAEAGVVALRGDLPEDGGVKRCLGRHAGSGLRQRGGLLAQRESQSVHRLGSLTGLRHNRTLAGGSICGLSSDGPKTRITIADRNATGG